MRYTYYISFWSSRSYTSSIEGRYVYTDWPINTKERMEDVAKFLARENNCDVIVYNNIIFVEAK